MRSLELHEDRFFDPDPAIRQMARALYEETRDLPIVGPHGHVPPEWLAENEPFPEPSETIIIPDHYIFRMLYSQGVELEDLGIPRRDGGPVETDPRTIWQRFADHYYLFRGTPTGAWLDHEFSEVFGVDVKLDSESAQEVYDQIEINCTYTGNYLGYEHSEEGFTGESDARMWVRAAWGTEGLYLYFKVRDDQFVTNAVTRCEDDGAGGEICHTAAQASWYNDAMDLYFDPNSTQILYGTQGVLFPNFTFNRVTKNMLQVQYQFGKIGSSER